MVCFWLAVFVGFVLIGFLLDFLMGRQGFGPYVNSVLALVGAWVGLYARYNSSPLRPLRALLELHAAVRGPVSLILILSFMRTRVF